MANAEKKNKHCAIFFLVFFLIFPHEISQLFCFYFFLKVLMPQKKSTKLKKKNWLQSMINSSIIIITSKIITSKIITSKIITSKIIHYLFINNYNHIKHNPLIIIFLLFFFSFFSLLFFCLKNKCMQVLFSKKAASTQLRHQKVKTTVSNLSGMQVVRLLL